MFLNACSNSVAPAFRQTLAAKRQPVTDILRIRGAPARSWSDARPTDATTSEADSSGGGGRAVCDGLRWPGRVDTASAGRRPPLHLYGILRMKWSFRISRQSGA